MSRKLFIAEQKNYSSWSLRAWLTLRWAGIEFEEHSIDLGQDGYGQGAIADLLAVSPNGLVPALAVGETAIWDTLAIAEWAAEQVPGLWPEDSLVRAQARSVTAEMHSGFAPVRRDLSMNILRRCSPSGLPEETLRSIARIEQIWTQMRGLHGGQGAWLFGRRSIADAFYLPVATRFRTYGIILGPAAQAYADTLLSDADFEQWEADCVADSWDHRGFSIIDGLFRD